MVFKASTGIRNILKTAALALAATVFTPTGILTVSRSDNMPLFAAVSEYIYKKLLPPNLLSGPYNRAGPIPLYNLLIPPYAIKFLNATVVVIPYLYW